MVEKHFFELFSCFESDLNEARAGLKLTIWGFFFFFGFSRQGFSVQPWLSWNSLCRPAGLELRNPPASASRVLGLKMCATTPGLDIGL
jgi:hypothetical protein